MAKPKLPAPHPLSTRNAADSLRLAIETQFRRCTEAVPGGPFDADPIPWMHAMLQRGTDVDLLVVGLARFQRLADWALAGTFATPQLQAAVATFKAAVPDLKQIRDTQEHWDEYGSQVGQRQKAGEPPSGFGYGLSAAGGVVTYGTFKLDIAAALAATRELHRAIRHDVDQLAGADVHGGPDTVLIPHP